jgi:hypothetical protein
MGLIDLIRGELERVDEKKSNRYPNGRGGYRRRKERVSGQKSKAPTYATIKDGLRKTSPGTIFTTKGSYRMYVTTADGWGKSKQQRVSGRTAKGFTPGSSTPSSKWSSIKSHAARTRVKHAGSTTKRHTAKARRQIDKGDK